MISFSRNWGRIKCLSCIFLLSIVAAASESFALHSSVTNYGRRKAPTKKSMCFTKKKNGDDGKAAVTEEEKIKAETWNPFRLGVLRLGLTEPAMTSPLNYGKYNGEFTCAYCGNTLFHSNAKYDSGSGWPSFWRTAAADSVDYKMEFDGRLEARCKKCKSHLGHVFLDGPRPSTVPDDLLRQSPATDPRGKNTNILPRFCINGAALKYRER